jgi:hypothetical protein
MIHALHPSRWRCLIGQYALPRNSSHHIQTFVQPRHACCLFPQTQPQLTLLYHHSPSSFVCPALKILIRLHGCCRSNRFEGTDFYPLAEFSLMGQVYLALTRPAPTTQASLPWEVVPGGIRIKTQQWVCPPGGEQARPACFGDSQLRVPDRSESDRLCSACMSLGHLKSTHWDSINNFRGVVVKHHHSLSALLESARGGCHFCGLLLTAWEGKCRLYQEPRGGWIGKADFNSASLDGDIKLRFQRVKTTIRLTGVKVDEVRITILCGDLLPGMGGQLICEPMDSERSLFLKCLQFLTINQ